MLRLCGSQGEKQKRRCLCLPESPAARVCSSLFTAAPHLLRSLLASMYPPAIAARGDGASDGIGGGRGGASSQKSSAACHSLRVRGRAELTAGWGLAEDDTAEALVRASGPACTTSETGVVPVDRSCTCGSANSPPPVSVIRSSAWVAGAWPGRPVKSRGPRESYSQ
eukprot:scaffold3329_cov120-Isochrysis_galbana.AAC.9